MVKKRVVATTIESPQTRHSLYLLSKLGFVKAKVLLNPQTGTTDLISKWVTHESVSGLQIWRDTFKSYIFSTGGFNSHKLFHVSINSYEQRKKQDM